MKKWMTSLLALCLLLGLTACGEKPEQPETPDPAPAETVQTETEEPKDPVEPAREATTQLEYLLEGEETTLAASLFTGDGYSIYIPVEGWLYEKDLEDDTIPSDSWENALNDEVELEILKFDALLEDVRAWVLREEDDYQLTEDKQGGLSGADLEDREYLDVRFAVAPKAVYAIFSKYPMEAMEGFGATMRVMADTIELTE